MIWLLIGYMWLFIHRPFEVWPWLGELRIERMYMIATILYWGIAVDKQLIRNRLNAAFALFWCVMLASCVLSPFQSSVENYFKVAVFYVLVITSVRTERDLKLLVIMFLGAMGLYMAHSLREYHCGRGVYRMGTWRMIGVDKTYNDPNSFAATVLYSLPMLLPAWTLVKKNWQRGLLFSYVGLAVLCILLTGSRSAFVGLCFLCFIIGLLSKHRVKVLLGLAVAAPLVWFSLRADLQNRFYTLIDPSYGPANAQTSAESRLQGWHDGVSIWKQHPLLGAGPGTFMAARGYQLQAHQLYGQVLGELGTFGALALATIVYSFFSNTLALRRLSEQEPELAQGFPAAVVSAVTIAVVLLLFDGLAGHNLYRYTWLWFGAFQAIAMHCIMEHAGELANDAQMQVLCTDVISNECRQIGMGHVT